MSESESKSENQDSNHAEQNPNLLRAVVKGVCARLWQWWTLENWTAAADLLVKFATILGVIVVGNFFVLRPEIAWEESYSEWFDEGRVWEFYGGKEAVPRSVLQIIEQVNSLPTQSYFELLKEVPILATVESFDYTPEPLAEDIMEVLREIYSGEEGDFWGGCLGPCTPLYAIDLAERGQLSADELKLALTALDDSVCTLARVRVSNNGQATAREVTIVPPEGFTRLDQYPESFDLPAGSSRIVAFRTDYGDVRSSTCSYFVPHGFSPTVSQFAASWKPSEVLDTETLVKIGKVLVALWFIIVLIEIGRPSAKEKETGGESGEPRPPRRSARNRWAATTVAPRTKMEDEMDIQVLVAYATKYGATAEIAEKIGQVLRQAGLRTDVLPANRVSDLTPYKAVVLGSAVYIGQWRKEATTFLKANEKALAERPVWLFSSGPTGEGDPVALLQDWHFPKALQPIADRIRPRDIAVFHGAVNMKKLNLIEKWMLKNVKAPLGDFRDWEAITSWATAIADVLKEAVS